MIHVAKKPSNNTVTFDLDEDETFVSFVQTTQSAHDVEIRVLTLKGEDQRNRSSTDKLLQLDLSTQRLVLKTYKYEKPFESKDRTRNGDESPAKDNSSRILVEELGIDDSDDDSLDIRMVPQNDHTIPLLEWELEKLFYPKKNEARAQPRTWSDLQRPISVHHIQSYRNKEKEALLIQTGGRLFVIHITSERNNIVYSKFPKLVKQTTSEMFDTKDIEEDVML